jgi:predicted nuclease of predicted toxin-antitoxin system
MMIRPYMDQHVPGAITEALRERGVDVLTAYEDGASELPDDLLLQRASVLGRVLFSRDSDLLREASLLQQAGTAFPGVI